MSEFTSMLPLRRIEYMASAIRRKAEADLFLLRQMEEDPDGAGYARSERASAVIEAANQLITALQRFEWLVSGEPAILHDGRLGEIESAVKRADPNFRPARY